VRSDDRPGARGEAGARPVGLLDRQFATAFVNGQFPWWASRGDQFARYARAVLATSAAGLRPAALRERLDDIGRASPAQRTDAFDMALVDAAAVAADVPASAGPAAARAYGLLAALTVGAYAAHEQPFVPAEPREPRLRDGRLPREPIVELWRPDFGRRPAPACRDRSWLRSVHSQLA
jgi:hypothetical protein